MRFLVKASFQWRRETRQRRTGSKQSRAFSRKQKPEAAYFVAENGKRTAILILNINDASEIAAIAEPWFLALSAAVEVTPVTLPEDLQKAAPAIAEAVKKYS
jgi:hypothetical protein